MEALLDAEVIELLEFQEEGENIIAKKLEPVWKAFDPFRRVLAIADALGVPVDADSLKGHMPGLWPTVGDLRELATALAMLEEEGGS